MASTSKHAPGLSLALLIFSALSRAFAALALHLVWNARFNDSDLDRCRKASAAERYRRKAVEKSEECSALAARE